MQADARELQSRRAVLSEVAALPLAGCMRGGPVPSSGCLWQRSTSGTTSGRPARLKLITAALRAVEPT